jgi:hypothetical protein
MNRCLRGGSWNNNDNNSEVLNRNNNNPRNRNNNYGFRLLKSLIAGIIAFKNALSVLRESIVISCVWSNLL